MKKLFSVLLVFSACAVNAQDVVIKKNGDEVEAKVSKVSDQEIEYKKWSNLNGPSYVMKTDEIFMIKYENGEKELFTDATQNSGANQEKPTANDSAQANNNAQTNGGSQRKIEIRPAANNAELIRRYHPDIRFITEPSDKVAKRFFPIMAVSESSILSTDELEINIVPEITTEYNIYGTATYYVQYYIEIKNKTDKTIYIDKANTFRIFNDDTSESYYDPNQVSVSSGGAAGVGVNLGGVAGALGIGGAIGTLAQSVNVGGASTGSVVQSYVQQRILAIPPHSMKHLSEYKHINVRGRTWKTISDIEYWAFNKPKDGSFIIKQGAVNRYDENNTPYRNKYHITYSTSQDFSTYSTIGFEVYAKYVVGDFYYARIARWEGKLKRDIQKIIPDFWNNPYILVGGKSHYF